MHVDAILANVSFVGLVIRLGHKISQSALHLCRSIGAGEGRPSGTLTALRRDAIPSERIHGNELCGTPYHFRLVLLVSSMDRKQN